MDLNLSIHSVDVRPNLARPRIYFLKGGGLGALAGKHNAHISDPNLAFGFVYAEDLGKLVQKVSRLVPPPGESIQDSPKWPDCYQEEAKYLNETVSTEPTGAAS